MAALHLYKLACKSESAGGFLRNFLDVIGSKNSLNPNELATNLTSVACRRLAATPFDENPVNGGAAQPYSSTSSIQLTKSAGLLPNCLPTSEQIGRSTQELACLKALIQPLSVSAAGYHGGGTLCHVASFTSSPPLELMEGKKVETTGFAPRVASASELPSVIPFTLDLSHRNKGQFSDQSLINDSKMQLVADC